MSEVFSKIQSAATSRKTALQSTIDEMEVLADVYEGNIPESYKQFFPQNTPTHIINNIKNAADDLSSDVARSPEVQVDPDSGTAPAKARAQKLEKIVQGYFQNARPFQGAFLFANAFNTIVFGHLCAIVTPDTAKGMPRFEARDPRTALPGVQRRVGNYVDTLSDMIFEYDMPYHEAVERGFAEQKTKNRFDSEAPKTIKIYEYIDDNFWVIASSDTVKRVEHGLGMVPVVYRQVFAPNSSGTGQFKQQVELMVAISRIITAKMSFIDKMLFPVTWVKGVQEDMTIGPNRMVHLEAQGEIGQLHPPMQLQVDRDLAQLDRYSRILNKNTEVRQGEVDGKGAYVGSKTLETLDDTVDKSLARFWEVLQSAYQELAAIALCMDEKLFDIKDKTISVVTKGQRHVETYTPSKDIDGRRDVRVAYGFGVGGGYQAFLETVQGYQAGLLPKNRAVRSMPGGEDSEALLRELELDALDEIAFANFAAMAQAGAIDMKLWSKYRMQMEKEDLSWYEAFQKYTEEFEQQAAAAAQQPVPDTAFTQAPEMPIEQEALPSVPPLATLGV